MLDALLRWLADDNFTFVGYREYPKYAMVSRYLVYKRALLDEAGRLVRAGVLRGPEDIDFLRFEELHEVVRTHEVDERLIRRRRDAFRSHQALTPPRVMTSAGEVVAGAYRRDDVPDGALVGLSVCGGAVEGRARVVRDMAEAELGLAFYRFTLGEECNGIVALDGETRFVEVQQSLGLSRRWQHQRHDDEREELFPHNAFWSGNPGKPYIVMSLNLIEFVD